MCSLAMSGAFLLQFDCGDWFSCQLYCLLAVGLVESSVSSCGMFLFYLSGFCMWICYS